MTEIFLMSSKGKKNSGLRRAMPTWDVFSLGGEILGELVGWEKRNHV